MSDDTIKLELTPQEARAFLQITEGSSQLFLNTANDLGNTSSGRRVLVLHKTCKAVAAQLRLQGITRLDGLDAPPANVTPLFGPQETPVLLAVLEVPETEPDTPESVERKTQGVGALIRSLQASVRGE